VLALTAVSFVAAQRASATPLGIPSTPVARADLDTLVVVPVDASCRPTSGSWFSEYDALTLTSASGVQIDHVVPLAEAWRSGASLWTTSKRQRFANDLADPELMAVSGVSNQSKSDQDPSTWKPRAAYACTYAKLWIGSKYAWSLRLQSTEKSSLQGMLNSCAP
jgi:hypothetical protein